VTRHCAGDETWSEHDVERLRSVAQDSARRADFFTIEVLTWKGVATYYVVFFNAFALTVRSIGQAGMSSEADSFGEASLKRALAAFIAHYDSERRPQGKENLLLFPLPSARRGQIVRRERLFGLLNYYAAHHEHF
jgi:hypothetical protein